MITLLRQKYDYFMYDLVDHRLDAWPFMTSPVPVLTLAGSYLLSVYILFPTFMKHRKPYDLKNFLFYYNIFQITACLLLIHRVLTSGWTTHYSLGCQIIDYSDDPLALKMVGNFYLTIWLKAVELVETVVFILRKKYNQVTKLHVYHHTSTLILAWVGSKYVAGGMASFPIIINSFIHVLMYTYYLLSSLGPEWQASLSKWKPKLTMFQMIQFCILILHSLQALHPDCHVPKAFLIIYVPNVVLVWNMFWNFYKDNYLKNRRKTSWSELKKMSTKSCQ